MGGREEQPQPVAQLQQPIAQSRTPCEQLQEPVRLSAPSKDSKDSKGTAPLITKEGRTQAKGTGALINISIRCMLFNAQIHF